jgi:hypothetical protein
MRVFFGYCLAVTAATLTFMAVALIRGPSSLPHRWDQLGSLLVVTTIAWILVFVFAALPFIIARAIAVKRKTRSILFELIGGGVTATLFSPLFQVFNLGINVPEANPEDLVRAAIVLAPFGALAGLVFWAFSVRVGSKVSNVD